VLATNSTQCIDLISMYGSPSSSGIQVIISTVPNPVLQTDLLCNLGELSKTSCPVFLNKISPRSQHLKKVSTIKTVKQCINFEKTYGKVLPEKGRAVAIHVIVRS